MGAFFVNGKNDRLFDILNAFKGEKYIALDP